MLYCTIVLYYCTALHCTVLHCTGLCCSVKVSVSVSVSLSVRISVSVGSLSVLHHVCNTILYWLTAMEELIPSPHTPNYVILKEEVGC